MAKLFSAINTERGTQVTRLGHRELSTYIQSNTQRVTVDGTPDSFIIRIERGRYENECGLTGVLAEVKNGLIIIHPALQERIIFKGGGDGVLR